MKNLFLLISMLFTSLVFSQESLDLDAFEGLDSTIGATIHIMKSQEHKMTISGDEKAIEAIEWEIMDDNLSLKSNNSAMDYQSVTITLHTPSIKMLFMTNGGVVTLDNKFSRINDFTVKADNGAVIDLSDVKFVNLVTHSSNGGEIRYQYSNHL